MTHTTTLTLLYGTALLYVNKTRGLYSDAYADKFPALLLPSYALIPFEKLIGSCLTMLHAKKAFAAGIDEKVREICRKTVSEIERSAVPLAKEMRERAGHLVGLPRKERIAEARRLDPDEHWFRHAFKDNLRLFSEGRRNIRAFAQELEESFPPLMNKVKNKINFYWKPY